jgi:hypothetical protein
MAKSRLTNAAKKIGAAMGKADRTAHVTAKRVAKASVVAKAELEHVAKQVEALKKQLAKSTKKLKKALA